MYLQKKDYEKAEKYYLEVLEKTDRRDVEVITLTVFNLGQLDMATGQYEKAEYMFKFLSDKVPQNPQYSSKLGVVYFIQGKYPEAAKYFKQTLNNIKGDKNLENEVRRALEETNKGMKE